MIASTPTTSSHHDRRRRQHETGDGRDTERDERRPLHGVRRLETGGDEAHRPDPGVVGPAHAVAVVVGVVDTDLEGDADDEARDRHATS